MLLILIDPCRVSENGEIDLEMDDELNVTEEEIAAEEDEEPDMMKSALYWDNFIALVDLCNEPWAEPEDDTDDYRKKRAVRAFNAGELEPPSPSPVSTHTRFTSPPLAGNKVANDILILNPELKAWVLHVLCFIVPRQIMELGDPSRRSCDACESLGSSIKKLIRHLTCRRRASTQLHAHKSRIGKNKIWTLAFKRSYIEQAFKRVSVRADLIYGEDNLRYLQRADGLLQDKGRASAAKFHETRDGISVVAAVEAPWVHTQEAALAVWS